MSSEIIPHPSFVNNILPFVDYDVKARHNSLYDILTAREERPTTTGAQRDGENPYLEVSNETTASWIEAKRIVIRDCYGHLLPLVVDQLRNGQRLIVGGTPGIGKTIFGLVLLRHVFLNPELSVNGVVYWDGRFATVISGSKDDVIKYGLNQEYDLHGRTIYMGSWVSNFIRLTSLLLDPHLYAIHDPAMDCTVGGMESLATSTVIILSYGHALVPLWNTKGRKPNTEFCLPFFQEEEILSNRANLFVDRGVLCNTHGDAASSLRDRFRKFGGNIRHWGRSTETNAWEELKANVDHVVHHHGVGIARRTRHHRGCLVHLEVEFDQNQPLFPSNGSNEFRNPTLVLGSDLVSDRFATVFQQYSLDQMKKSLRLFASDKGVEAVYGILFETYAHKLLCSSDVEVNLRVTRSDGNNQNSYASTVLPVRSQRRFPVGRDGGTGWTDTFPRDTVELGTYLRPESSRTFPMYDAITTVPGEAVGLPAQKHVALLLQMTVSGASGLRRLAKHSMKQSVRTDLDQAVRTMVKEFDGPCITAFCVPTVCFQSFLFQFEDERNDTNHANAATTVSRKQPPYQWVIEIPDFVKLPEPPANLPRHEIQGTTGRMHRYQLGSTQPSKKQKFELHVLEE